MRLKGAVKSSTARKMCDGEDRVNGIVAGLAVVAGIWSQARVWAISVFVLVTCSPPAVKTGPGAIGPITAQGA